MIGGDADMGMETSFNTYNYVVLGGNLDKSEILR